MADDSRLKALRALGKRFARTSNGRNDGAPESADRGVGDAVRALEAAAASRGSGGAVAAAAKARVAVRGGGANARAWRAAGGLSPLAKLVVATAKGRAASARAPLLSALADCCTEPSCRLDVGRMDVEPALVAILKRAHRDDDDDVVCKACRALANLAADADNAEKLHAEGVTDALVAVVDADGSSPPTLHAAIRAIRMLWAVEDRRREMITSGAVKAVIERLCKSCREAELIDANGRLVDDEPREPCKRLDDLFVGSLKCIGYFTLYSSFPCAQQIFGEGLGYRCLVSLCGRYESLVLQSILNLCYVPKCRSLLGNAGAVKCAIDALNSNPEGPITYLKILRLLSRESNNRLKIEEYGGLAVLLLIAKDTSKPHHHLYALQTLHSFIFNEIGLVILAKEGFIDIIAQLLKNYVSTMKCEHQPFIEKSIRQKKITDTKDVTSGNESIDSDNKDIVDAYMSEFDKFSPKVSPQKKTKLDHTSKNYQQKQQTPYLSPYSEPSSPSNSECHKTSKIYSASSSHYFRGDRSPESTCSSIDVHGYIYGGSTLLSPESVGMSFSPSSVSQLGNESSDSEKSGHYSPVCTDAEDETIKISVENDTSDSKSASDLSEDDEINKIKLYHKIDIDSISDDEIKAQSVKYLLGFLCQYSFLPRKEFKVSSSGDLLLSLIGFLEKCKYPRISRATKALHYILKNVVNFKYILTNSIILNLQNVIQNSKHVKCKQCKQVSVVFTKSIDIISSIAESDYGIKEIAIHLAKENITYKETLLLSVPYMIKTTYLLKKVFNNYKVLDLFLDIFTYEKESLEYSVPSLTKLATMLHIRAPQPIYAKYKNYVFLEYNPCFDTDEEVIFELDDSSTISANRKLLCKHSDVFVAMFHGLFKESEQKCIKLQKASKPGLEYLFTLLESGTDAALVEIFPLPKVLSTALETLLLADRFLMENLKNLLFSAIIQFKLNFDNADQIYIWSLEEGMGVLCAESIAYILVGKMNNDKKCRIISTILNSMYKKQWIEDVKYSLTRFLT